VFSGRFTVWPEAWTVMKLIADQHLPIAAIDFLQPGNRQAGPVCNWPLAWVEAKPADAKIAIKPVPIAVAAGAIGAAPSWRSFPFSRWAGSRRGRLDRRFGDVVTHRKTGLVCPGTVALAAFP
jgi:hypothetical protein